MLQIVDWVTLVELQFVSKASIQPPCFVEIHCVQKHGRWSQLKNFWKIKERTHSTRNEMLSNRGIVYKYFMHTCLRKKYGVTFDETFLCCVYIRFKNSSAVIYLSWSIQWFICGANNSPCDTKKTLRWARIDLHRRWSGFPCIFADYVSRLKAVCCQIAMVCHVMWICF